MIYIGIDIAKEKHDCCIINENSVLIRSFTVANSLEGFEFLFQSILEFSPALEAKVGLEATGHYSNNLIRYLKSKGLQTFVINPLRVATYKKSQSLRRTKTDTIDSLAIANILKSELNLIPYTQDCYHTKELKSLARYRLKKVKERAKDKVSISRLVTILFPELETVVNSIHSASIYALLSCFPSADAIKKAKLKDIEKLISKASRGRFTLEKAKEIQGLAKTPIGSVSISDSLELKQTIASIESLDQVIAEIEAEQNKFLAKVQSPITSIAGLGENMTAMIIGEIGDFTRFESADKILAYAGFSPTTYQSGKFYSNHAKIEKRGSKYLRYALFHAAKNICIWDKTFSDYLAKKRAEGKHYFVALSHAVKKLVRVIYKLQITGEIYTPKT